LPDTTNRGFQFSVSHYLARTEDLHTSCFVCRTRATRARRHYEIRPKRACISLSNVVINELRRVPRANVVMSFPDSRAPSQTTRRKYFAISGRRKEVPFHLSGRLQSLGHKSAQLAVPLEVLQFKS